MTEFYEGEWHRAFDAAGIRAEHFNGRLLLWINAQLSSAYTNLPEAMQAYAESEGAYNWSSLGLTGPPEPAPPGDGGVVDFSDPDNNWLIAALFEDF